MIDKIKNLVKKLYTIDLNLNKLSKSVELQNNLKNAKVLTAKILIELNKQKLNIRSLQEVEFQVFSQWGDDGIIQYLVNTIQIENENFIEFGVQDYTESNTRFLLINNNWKGLVMDGSKNDVNYIKKDEIYWKYNLKALEEFITAENINAILEREGFTDDVGLFHIDIDGNDYWIWEATEVIRPIIVIVEYQSLFGDERAITTPYKPDFVRTKMHYSDLYYGASIAALCDLAEKKGYYFVGCNSAGNNAYFIRKDKIGNIKILRPKEGYVMSKFKESKDVNGNLTYIAGDNRLNSIKNMEVFNIMTNTLEYL